MPAQAHLSARSPDVGRAAGRAVSRLPNRRPNALPRRGQECRPNRSRGPRPYGSMPPAVPSAGRPSHGRSGAGSFVHRKLRLVEVRAGNHEFRFRSSVPRTHRKIERSEERETAAETAPPRAARVTAMLPPPRAELYRRDLVGIVVAAGPRHRTRGPVGHDEKEPPPDRRDIRCGRSVRHRALHPVRAAHRAGPHIRRPSPASVCKAPYPLCTPARVGTSEPIPGRMPPLQPMCRTPRLTVAPVRASSSALKEQPPILSAFAAGRAENRKRTAVRLSGRMLRGNRWRSVETPQFAMLEISVPVFAERCHPCPVSSSLALAAGPVPYASGGSSRTRAGRSPAEPGARRQKR